MKNTLVEALRLQRMPEAFDGKTYVDKFGYALKRWAYVRELMFLGYYRHGKITGNDIEIRLIKNYIDALIDEGIDNEINFDYASTDQISQANALLFLYDEFGEEKYKELAGRFFEAMLKFPRTKQGSFWHKSNYRKNFKKNM